MTIIYTTQIHKTEKHTRNREGYYCYYYYCYYPPLPVGNWKANCLNSASILSVHAVDGN